MTERKEDSKEQEELASDKEIIDKKIATIKKELASKRTQLDLLLKSFPQEEPIQPEDKENYQRLKQQIETTKHTIAQKQNELMDLLKNQSNTKEMEEEL